VGDFTRLVDLGVIVFGPDSEDVSVSTAVSGMLNEELVDVAGAVSGQRVFEEDATRIAMLRSVGLATAGRVRTLGVAVAVDPRFAPSKRRRRAAEHVEELELVHRDDGTIRTQQGGLVDVSLHRGSPWSGMLLRPRRPSTAVDERERPTWRASAAVFLHTPRG